MDSLREKFFRCIQILTTSHDCIRIPSISCLEWIGYPLTPQPDKNSREWPCTQFIKPTTLANMKASKVFSIQFNLTRRDFLYLAGVDFWKSLKKTYEAAISGLCYRSGRNRKVTSVLTLTIQVPTQFAKDFLTYFRKSISNLRQILSGLLTCNPELSTQP